MLGGGATVKAVPAPTLLASPPTVTTTFPVVAPAGTATMMLVALQLVTVAAVPLNVTVLVPWAAPKPVPVIVTAVPTGPDVGAKLLMLGGTVTVKTVPLLDSPPTVTTTFPVVAKAGTATMTLVVPQLVTVAAVPLNVTVLVPWAAPKPVPVIVTAVPTGPDVGAKLLMLGGTVPVIVYVADITTLSVHPLRDAYAFTVVVALTGMGTL
jgi:hypothetical protein